MAWIIPELNRVSTEILYKYQSKYLRFDFEMEKICPKCLEKHSKKGMFCSRKCANARVFNNEAKELKRQKNILFWECLSEDKKTEHINRIKTLAANRKNMFSDLAIEKLSHEARRNRVIREQENKCARCNINEWLGEKITLELEHIDGNTTNNKRDNLEALCPNCHSLTLTWRGRNKDKNKISDDQLMKAISTTKNIHQALLKVGLAAKGKNYAKVKKLMEDRVGFEPTWIVTSSD